MKKTICLILTACTLLSFAACGAAEPEVKQEPAGMESVLPGNGLSDAGQKETGEKHLSDSDVIIVDDTEAHQKLASKLLGNYATAISEILGEYDSKEEVPNCLGAGKRFIYTYDALNLQVHTYSEGTEVVTDLIYNEGTENEEVYSLEN